MLAFDVTMQVRPSQASYITTSIRAIVPQQQYCVFEDIVVLVLDPEVFVHLREIGVLEILIALGMIIREDNIVGFRLVQSKCQRKATTKTKNDDQTNHILDNEHKLYSYTRPSISAHKYDKSGDYTARPRCGRPSKHK